MGSHLELAITVVAALIVVLAATTVCGRLAVLVRQPRVVGEMVAGVLLGPAVLGAVAPGIPALLFPDDVKGVLYVLSTIGLTFYMFLVGMGLDHGVLDRPAVRRAAALATSGIVPTFVLGACAAVVLYDELAVPGSGRWEFMLFVGGALAITSLPLLARILEERGVAHTRVGGLVLVAAAIDDAAAWVILAVIVAIGAAAGPLGALITILGATVFAIGMLTAGRSLLRRLGDRVDRAGAVRRDTMTIVFLVVLAAGFVTDLVGVFSVFGGFVTGLAMPRSALLRRELEARLSDLNTILLLPVFFAFSGLNTRLDGFGSVGALLGPLALILFVAMAGKYVGCGLTMRAQGFSWRYASAVGGLMSARGLMILIFINIGLTYDLITDRLFSTMVIVAIVTTAAALPIYRASMPSWLEQAEKDLSLNSFGARIQPLYIPEVRR